MNDHDFQLKVSEDLGAIKADLEYLKRRFPECKGDENKINISINRKLIFLLLGINIPLLIKAVYDKII